MIKLNESAAYFVLYLSIVTQNHQVEFNGLLRLEAQTHESILSSGQTFFVCFLVQVKTTKNPFEINWHLIKTLMICFTFSYSTASATAKGQKRKFVRAKHSDMTEGENCAYSATLKNSK